VAGEQRILERLRQEGHRLTRGRKAIVGVFSGARVPLTVGEVHASLGRKGVSVNQTTVYREVDFLKGLGLLREIRLGDGQGRYEFLAGRHHHHLVCIRCRSIQCVELRQCVELAEERIVRESNFRVMEHSLEFFGLCADCQGTPP
jgi:Fe2+ or Zn2+ uptake regulation protein